jgi:CheY-like chemotaxis protein
MSKILLVEDDATMQMLLKTLLELDKHQVTIIGDLTQNILQTVLDLRPDILIMDVNLRQISWKLYILMTSGMDFQDECRKAGADAFLLKPYMPEELARQLKKAQSM